MDPYDSCDQGYHTQQYTILRPSTAAGNSYVTSTPDGGGFRVIIPSGGGGSSQNVSTLGNYDRDSTSGMSPVHQVYRVGPRYNNVVTNNCYDRRGSVDSGLSHIIRLRPNGQSQMVRVRGGGDFYIHQQQQPQSPSTSTTRVLRFEPGMSASQTSEFSPGRDSTGFSAVPTSTPSVRQVIHIGPQGVRVAAVQPGYESPSARIYRLVPLNASAASSQETGDAEEAYHRQVDADRHDVIQPAAGGWSAQPRLVRRVVGKPSPLVIEQNTSPYSSMRGSTDTGVNQPATYNANYATVYSSGRQWSDDAPDSIQYEQGGSHPVRPVTSSPQRYFRVSTPPNVRAAGGGSSRSSFDESASPPQVSSPTASTRCYDLDGPGRFRVQITSGGGRESGSNPPSRRPSTPSGIQDQQQVPNIAGVGPRVYYCATGNGGNTVTGGRGSPVVQIASGQTVGDDGYRQPAFTVHTVGRFDSGSPSRSPAVAVGGKNITDFGELICNSIRQFLAQKQQQQQQPSLASGESDSQNFQLPANTTARGSASVPSWNNTIYSNPDAGFETGKTSWSTPHTGSSGQALTSQQFDAVSPQRQRSTGSPSGFSEDNRNIFQKCKFQFGSIGNYSRSNSRDNMLDDNCSGSNGMQGQQQQHPTALAGTGSGPIAVFFFQDFDDMVAKIREMRDQVNTPTPAASKLTPRTDEQQYTVADASQDAGCDVTRPDNAPVMQPPVSIRRFGNRESWPSDEDDGEDSGYHTATSSSAIAGATRPGYRQRPSIPALISEDSPQLAQKRISRELLRHRIAAFNNNNHGFIISLEQNSDIYHGIIRVQMNLIRPVQMSMTSDDEIESRGQHVPQQHVASFCLPKDTTKVIHINSETSAKEVISTLLSKYRIRDNPRKFALYEKFDNDGAPQMRRLGDDELPLPLCLSWTERGIDYLQKYKFVLQENDTGEILWEAFSLPELETFLSIINKEEDEYFKQIKSTYKLMKIHLQRRLKELKKSDPRTMS